MASTGPVRLTGALLANDWQVLPKADDYFLLRSWEQVFALSGKHASVAGKVLSAVDAERDYPGLAVATGAPVATVKAVTRRLEEQGLLSLDTPATAEQTEFSVDAALHAVVTDDRSLHGALTAELGSRVDAHDLIITDNPYELSRHAVRRPGRVVLPREVVESYGDEVGALLSSCEQWACYWREPGRVVVISNLSGTTGLCHACLLAREEAAARRANASRDDRIGMAAERDDDCARNVVDDHSVAMLLAHVLVATGREEDPYPGSVLYELYGDRVVFSRVLGLPVCPTCTAVLGSDGAPGNALDLLRAPRSRAPGHRHRREGDDRQATVSAPDFRTPEYAVDLCKRSSDLPDHEMASLICDISELFGRNGLISTVRPEHPRVATSHFNAVRAELADIWRISASNGPWQAYDAGGAAWTMAGALRSCIGEAIERYCALVHGTARRVVWGTETSLDHAVPIERFATFSAAELQTTDQDFNVASSASLLGWVPGQNLVTDRSVLVPAQLSLLAYTAASFEDRVHGNTNKGLAAGRTKDHCLVHGICELIEAEALLVHFLNRSPVPELDLAGTGHGRIDRVNHAIRSEGGRLRVWDFGTDLGVPTLLAMIERCEEGQPIATFGMATRPDPAQALEKAVLEALQGTCWLTGELLETARNLTSVPSPSWAFTRGRAKSLGGSKRYLAELEWLLDRESRRPFHDYALSHTCSPNDPAAQRQRLVKTLAANGLEPIAVELSTPDVRASTGLQVWRSVVPGLHPFSIGALQARASDRLFSVPVRMGYRAAPMREADLNPLPHPCP